MSDPETGTRSTDAAQRPIEVRMLVTPPEESGCSPVTGQSSSVKQSLRMEGDGDAPCHVIRDGDDVRYEQFTACKSCPCFLMQFHDCVPQLEEIRDGRLLYSVTFSDRSELPALVESLRTAGATVTVTRILAVGEAKEELPTLTEKQHETIRMAVRAGYYDRPRSATLDDIAGELGITTSAASQRLNSAKRRLIDTYITAFEAGQVC